MHNLGTIITPLNNNNKKKTLSDSLSVHIASNALQMPYLRSICLS